MKLTNKNVLVTGGAGFIGSHLVDRIICERPHNLVVVDNLFLGSEQNLSQARHVYPALKVYTEDAADYTSMQRILGAEQIEVVFNLAVIPLPTSLIRPRWAVDVNTAIATVASELLREGYYQTLIHFSSSEAYGTAQYTPMDEGHPLLPKTPYAASKAAGDHVVLSYADTFGLDVAVVRPFNNYGPRQNSKAYAGVIPITIRRAQDAQPMIVFGDGEQTRDFTFVRDTAEATVRIYEEAATRGRVINVATGHEVSINQLVRQILDITAPHLPIEYASARPGDVLRHCGSIEVLRSLVGFEPKLLSHQTLSETVEWYLRSDQ